jgi:hypothetical protein
MEDKTRETTIKRNQHPKAESPEDQSAQEAKAIAFRLIITLTTWL